MFTYMHILLALFFVLLCTSCNILGEDEYERDYIITQELPHGETLDSIVVVIMSNDVFVSRQVHCSAQLQTSADSLSTCQYYDVLYDLTTLENKLTLPLSVDKDVPYTVSHTSYSRGRALVHGGKSFTGGGEALGEATFDTLNIEVIRNFPESLQDTNVITFDDVKGLVFVKVTDTLGLDSADEYVALYRSYLASDSLLDSVAWLDTLQRHVLDTILMRTRGLSEKNDAYGDVLAALGLKSTDSILQSWFYSGAYSYDQYLEYSDNPYITTAQAPFTIHADTMVQKTIESLLLKRPSVDAMVPIDDSYLIAPFEVTTSQYILRMGGSASQGVEQMPKTNITPRNMMRYCNTRSLADGLVPAYTNIDSATVGVQVSNGYRLPTKDEWQKAYSYGYTPDLTVAYFWGYSQDSETVQKYVNRTSTLLSVGMTVYPNLANLYDLSGNAAEVILSNGIVEITGGSYLDVDMANYRLGYYKEWALDSSSVDVGFRVVRGP